jgi:hypothetical protein
VPPTGGDPSPSPLANARHRLDAIRGVLEQTGTSCGVVVSKTISGGVLHAIVDEIAESGPCRTARWYAVNGYTHGVSIFRLSLTAPVERWGDPIVPYLIELFAAQAAAGLATAASITDRLGLRDIRVRPGMIISVPASWTARPDEHGVLIWGPKGVPGVIAEAEMVEDPAERARIGLDGSAAHLSRPALALHVAGRFARTLTVSTLSRPIEPVLFGALVTTEMALSSGRETVTHWYYLIPCGESCVIASFVLDIPTALRERPEMIEARALLARAIAELRLEPDDDLSE